jgi:transposase-like protein
VNRVLRPGGAIEEDGVHGRAAGSNLREDDQRPVPEVAKKHGVSAQTIYGWRKHFGTLEPVDVKRLRQLGQENGPAQEDGNLRAVRLSADQGSGAMSVQATPRRSQARPRS